MLKYVIMLLVVWVAPAHHLDAQYEVRLEGGVINHISRFTIDEIPDFYVASINPEAQFYQRLSFARTIGESSYINVALARHRLFQTYSLGELNGLQVPPGANLLLDVYTFKQVTASLAIGYEKRLFSVSDLVDVYAEISGQVNRHVSTPVSPVNKEPMTSSRTLYGELVNSQRRYSPSGRVGTSLRIGRFSLRYQYGVTLTSNSNRDVTFRGQSLRFDAGYRTHSIGLMYADPLK